MVTVVVPNAVDDRMSARAALIFDRFFTRLFHDRLVDMSRLPEFIAAAYDIASNSPLSTIVSGSILSN